MTDDDDPWGAPEPAPAPASGFVRPPASLTDDEAAAWLHRAQELHAEQARKATARAELAAAAGPESDRVANLVVDAAWAEIGFVPGPSVGTVDLGISAGYAATLRVLRAEGLLD